MDTKKKWMIAAIAGTLLLASPLYVRDIGQLGQTNHVQAAEATAQAEKRIITVSGQGEITITPDVAYIMLGVQTEATTANEAQTANAKAFAELEKVLYEQYKLDKKDVKTTGFSVNPQYSYTDNDPKIKGYIASQTLEITWRDLDSIGPFLDAASRAGSNRINGVRFSTEKSEAYELQAIDKAMENALAKAETIARHTGKPLGGIVNVIQGSSGGAPVLYSNVGLMKDVAYAAESMPSTSISVGELKISTSVTVQYEF